MRFSRLPACAARAFVVLAAACFTLCAQAGEIKPWKGGATPALALPDLDGREHTLAEFKGRVVVVNFWATWCDPCRAEMPSMQKMADKFGADKLVVLGINYQEGAPRIRRFLEQNPVRFTILMDRDGTATKKWITRIFPTSMIIGPDGRVRHVVVGDYEWDGPAMDALITRLLPKT
ncbi:MAG TPA: TlpA disulfide reductase family protein [Burkholderiales bacterium]|jgi:thiol-disulfide isomerase/thioredoxin|nr:TlpA disulfide reductase family protein [Burkholderiales bacterium]